MIDLFNKLLLFVYLLPVGMIFPKLIGTSGFGIMSTFLIQKIVQNKPPYAAMLICFKVYNISRGLNHRLKLLV